MNKYKLWSNDFDQREPFYIDDMPLHDYLWYLTLRRRFNYNLVIDYTKDLYKIDLTEIISELKDVPLWEETKNIYDNFYNQSSNYKTENNTREYFNSKGRKLYEKFAYESHYDLEFDCLMQQMYTSDIHHIFPLVYGGDNSVHNLIHLSKFNHDLLHENPLENIREYNFKALDYLGTLYSPNQLNQIFKKYNLHLYESNSLLLDIFKAGIREEMRNFYNKIQKEKS